jgi:fucose 4-O-acetylase-like acetyltransferase
MNNDFSKQESIEKEHINWIDVLKFLGIFAIYLAHFGQDAGPFYLFGFAYRVPLFFFAAGCLESVSSNNSTYPRFVFQKFKILMVPFIFFVVVNLAITGLANNIEPSSLLSILKQDLMGIRNQITAAGLWFIPCIFVMEVVFRVLKQFLKNKWVIFLASLVLFIIATQFLGFDPTQTPRWFWNIDSALAYIPFFALGYLVFPSLISLFKMQSIRISVVLIVSGLICFGYALRLYFGKDLLQDMILPIKPIMYFYPIIKAIPLIWCNILLAVAFQNIEFLQKIGRNTLWLCGFEHLYKFCVSTLIALFGLKLQLQNPLATFLYVLALVLLSTYTIIPVGKSLYYSLLPWLKTKNATGLSPTKIYPQ